MNHENFCYFISKRGPKSEIPHIWKTYLMLEIVKQDKCPKKKTIFSLKGIQAVRIEFFFILKVANIRCFILIAVDIFHNIILATFNINKKNQF
jgi:hypothetical protein